MKLAYLGIVLLGWIATPVIAADPTLPAPDQSKIKNLVFEKNSGQWDAHVKYRASYGGFVMYLQPDRFRFHFTDRNALDNLAHRRFRNGEPIVLPQAAIDLRFVNSSPEVKLEPSAEADFKTNYFLGNVPALWHPNVPSYSEILYNQLYHGVSLNLRFNNGFPEYDFRIEPGTDPSLIVMQSDGQSKLALDAGQLEVDCSLGKITHLKPVAYQIINGKQRRVECRFVIHGDRITFDVGSYDHSKILVIDPTLVVSTYTGSTADNWGFTATYDDYGNIYSSGIAAANGYPTTTGSFQQTFGGGGSGGFWYPFDISITKYNPTGTALIFSTYLGGSDNESPSSLVVNSHDRLLVLGRTYSANFPVTAGAYDNTFNGGSDIIVTEFDSTGSALINSTFVGGSAEDGVNVTATEDAQSSLKFNYSDDGRGEVHLDNNDRVYIVSSTKSNDFPVTPGAFQPTFGGGSQDGCVFRLSADLSVLEWSSYLGGNQEDACYSVNNGYYNGALYVCGGTNSPDFHTTAGTLTPTYQGSIDGFLTCIDTSGTSIIASTYIGTPQYDQTYFVQVDKSNGVYILGQTMGTFPVSTGVYSNANSSQYIQKINPTLDTIIYSTVFGNGSSTPNISPTAFLVDRCHNIYVAGWGRCLDYGSNPGNNNGMPITLNAFQSTTDGCDFYFFVLNHEATSLWYASYFGTGTIMEHVDGGTSRFDPNGKIYEAACAGCGGSDLFPTTPGAWSQLNGSTNCNNAVIKYDFELPLLIAAAAPSPSFSGCAPYHVQFANGSTNAQSYIWNFGDGSAIDTTFVPSHTYTSTGVMVVSLIAMDSIGCTVPDTSQFTIHIYPDFAVNLGNDTLICGTPSIQLQPVTPASGFTFNWSDATIDSTLLVDTIGVYWVTVNNGGCTHTDSISVQAVVPPTLGNDTTFCSGNIYILNSGNPGATHTWSTGDTTQSITVNASGTYSVVVAFSACLFSDTVQITVLPIAPVNLGNDTSLCGSAMITLNAGNAGTNYTWSTGQTSSTIQVSNSGTYSVLVFLNTCATADTIHINMIPYPVPILPGDTLICNTDSLELNASNSGYLHLWSTGATSAVLSVSEPGMYIDRISNSGCLSFDTIRVRKLDQPNIGSDTLFCGDFEHGLNAHSLAPAYLWSNGSRDSSIHVNEPGIYWLQVTDQYCVKGDTILIAQLKSGLDSMFIPNIMTANGDGMNDRFITHDEFTTHYRLDLFNRWGKRVFTTESVDDHWDGEYASGGEAPAGDYFYIITYTPTCPVASEPKTKRGFVTLVR